MDGLWARPYIASFNPETGETEKAFLLPQKDPMFYDNYTYTYNRPELIKKPVTNGKEFEKIIPQAAILSTPKKNHKRYSNRLSHQYLAVYPHRYAARISIRPDNGQNPRNNGQSNKDKNRKQNLSVTWS